MQKWRELAVQLFPDMKTIYTQPEETVWGVLRDLQEQVVEAHKRNNTGLLERIYGFAAWCHSQREVDAELWTAAYAVFYEHLVEHEETYRQIKHWLKPEIFRDVLPEFKDRLDNEAKYPGPKPGTFRELLEHYDQANDTHFV